MDSNKRFDQLESLLVDLARKQDQQGEKITQIITELNRQGKAIDQLSEALERQGEALEGQSEAIERQGEAIGRQSEAIGRQGEAIGRQEKLLTIVSEQADGIIEFLKLSTTRHAETERQQAEMMTEIQRLGKRTDASVEAIKLLLKRQENTDTRLDGVVQTQLQMLQLQRLDADQLAELNRRLPAAENQEPRIKRLEDEVFRAAS
jgi:predicted transcriptional regulator